MTKKIEKENEEAIRQKMELFRQEMKRIIEKYSVTSDMLVESVKNGKFEKYIKSLITKEKEKK